MAGLAGDPAAALKEISAEVQEKFDEAGMGKVEEFMDQMDDVMAKARDGPGMILKAAQEQVDGIQKKLEAALADPSSLVPSGGGVAACAAGYYGGEVAKKLRAVSDDTSGLVAVMTKMAEDVQKPMKDLAEGLEKALSQLEGSVKGLAKLPKLIQQEMQGKDSPDDIAKIDTAPMKKALDGGDMDGPLSAIGGMKDILEGAIAVLRSGAEALQGFLESAPGAVRHAFDLPAPLCALQSVLMSQAPQLMTDLLGMLDKLQGVSLQPVMDAMNGTMDKVANLDMEQIKAPVNKFMESAKDLVEKLDKTVSGAKLATGGGMPSLGGMGGFGK